MNRCPNCQKEIDIEHYKKRGNCKFCGYKLDLDSSDDSSSKSKLIRTSANKIKNKGNISESSNKSSQKQLLNEKTVQTEQEYIPDIASIDSSDKSISDDVQPISLSHGTEKTETLKVIKQIHRNLNPTYLLKIYMKILFFLITQDHLILMIRRKRLRLKQISLK